MSELRSLIFVQIIRRHRLIPSHGNEVFVVGGLDCRIAEPCQRNAADGVETHPKGRDNVWFDWVENQIKLAFIGVDLGSEDDDGVDEATIMAKP